MILAPTLVAGVLAAVYLVWEPPSADLAAQTFRADLADAHGFVLWNDAWYAGHHVPGYSLLFPPLGAALGARLAGALATVAAALLFAVLAREQFGERARLGVLWFAAGSVTMLFTGRLTFAVGVAVGLGALVALQRHRLGTAGGLAALSTLASPVAGLFTGLAGVAVGLAGERRGGAVVALGAGAAMTLMVIAFPTSGTEPFVVSSFLAIPAFALAALALLPREERALRLGAAIYAALALVVFAIDNPLGGNLVRLGALFGGPVMLMALMGRRSRLALVAVAVPLLYWQWIAPVNDVGAALDDPSVERSYHQPLIAELERRTAGEPVRIEIPPTDNRWEAVHVAPRFPLARGWLRQLESDDFELFDHGNLTEAAYRRWLAERGVSYVAVSDADPDYLAEDEVALIQRGPEYLREVWRNPNWVLYEVEGSPGLLSPDSGADLREVSADGFELAASEAGSYLVRVRHTGYWTVAEGDACVRRDGDWTRVVANDPGTIRVEARLSLAGMMGRDEECSG